MNKIKTTYERPTTDVLVIRFEGSLLTLSNPGNNEGFTKDADPYDDGWNDAI